MFLESKSAFWSSEWRLGAVLELSHTQLQMGLYLFLARGELGSLASFCRGVLGEFAMVRSLILMNFALGAMRMILLSLVIRVVASLNCKMLRSVRTLGV